MVAAAMARVPLPPSQIDVQPANGRTLVNFDTNFFTGTRAFDVPLNLLGQRVDLHIVPSEFDWQFGDGESLVTEEPGAPYPDLDVTHRYLKKGQVAARVDTTWTATYQVNGGPSIKVKGQVTIPGAAGRPAGAHGHADARGVRPRLFSRGWTRMIRTRWALATLLATCLLGACSDDDPEPDIADPTASASSSNGDGESFADCVGHAGLGA